MVHGGKGVFYPKYVHTAKKGRENVRELHTERLLLRTPRERDAAEIMAIRNSAFVMKNNVMEVFDKEQMVHLIHREIDYEDTWYMERKEDGALLGMIAAEEDGVRFDVRSRCLSYYLGEQYTRQGYMKEALRAVLHELFTEEDLEVVAARVFAGNIASEKLLRSLGFVYEGCIRRCVRTSESEIRDDMQFSLLREEYFEAEK